MLVAGNIVLKCFCFHSIYSVYLDYMCTGFIRNTPNYSQIDSNAVWKETALWWNEDEKSLK
jgi:hypothetical protein